MRKLLENSFHHKLKLEKIREILRDSRWQSETTGFARKQEIHKNKWNNSIIIMHQNFNNFSQRMYFLAIAQL